MNALENTSLKTVVRSQICEIIVMIAKHDFPYDWPQLMDDMFHTKKLEIAQTIFQRYRYELASDDLWLEIKFVSEKIATELTSKVSFFAQQISQSGTKDYDEEQLHEIVSCVNIFHSLNSQELIEVFEDSLQHWMNAFSSFLSIDIHQVSNLVEI